MHAPPVLLRRPGKVEQSPVLADMAIEAEGCGEMSGGEDGLFRPGGEDPALLEDEHMGDPGVDLLDVVGDDDQGRGLRTLGELADIEQEVVAGGRVEAGAGLVEDQQGGLVDQGSSDEDPLLLAL